MIGNRHQGCRLSIIWKPLMILSYSANILSPNLGPRAIVRYYQASAYSLTPTRTVSGFHLLKLRHPLGFFRGEIRSMVKTIGWEGFLCLKHNKQSHANLHFTSFGSQTIKDGCFERWWRLPDGFWRPFCIVADDILILTFLCVFDFSFWHQVILFLLREIIRGLKLCFLEEIVMHSVCKIT